MIEEHASLMASRAEVRRKVDEAIESNARRLAPVRRAPTEEEIEAEREARINDPRNEHGAQSLMALAAGAAKTRRG